MCTSKEIDVLKEIVDAAIIAFNTEETYLLHNDLSERCICARFAMHLTKALIREVFILTLDGEYIAECDLVYDNPEYGTIPGKRLYLSRLIVKKEQRGKGYGKAISKYVLDLAKEKGYREIALGVNCDNIAAVRLYENLGFTVYEEAEDEDGKFYRMEKKL